MQRMAFALQAYLNSPMEKLSPGGIILIPRHFYNQIKHKKLNSFLEEQL